MRLRGVLLDVDGTLVDSNDAHARAWVDVLRESGRAVPFARVRQLIGMGGDHLLPAAVDVDEKSAEGRQLSERRTALFKERYLPHLRAFPKVRELLTRLRDDGLRLTVATSARPDELRALLDAAGVADLIGEAASSGDAEQSKPDPDIVRAALGRSGRRPDEVLMLGDTPYDIEAASKAGVRTVALRCGGWDDDALRGALARYGDPADLLARYDNSPFARFHEETPATPHERTA